MIIVFANIVSFAYLIPFLIGLGKFSYLGKREKTYFYFITVATFCSLLSYITSQLGNNLFVAYIFNTSEILVLPFFLLSDSDKKSYKPIWVLGVIIGLGLILFEALIREGGTSMFNSLSLTYAAFMLSALSIRSLLKLRYDPNLYDLSKSPEFWFTLSTGVYYLGSILIFSCLRLFQQQDMQLLFNIFTARLFIITISIFLATWGFIKVKRSP